MLCWLVLSRWVSGRSPTVRGLGNSRRCALGWRNAPLTCSRRWYGGTGGPRARCICGGRCWTAVGNRYSRWPSGSVWITSSCPPAYPASSRSARRRTQPPAIGWRAGRFEGTGVGGDGSAEGRDAHQPRGLSPTGPCRGAAPVAALMARAAPRTAERTSHPRSPLRHRGPRNRGARGRAAGRGGGQCRKSQLRPGVTGQALARSAAITRRSPTPCLPATRITDR